MTPEEAIREINIAKNHLMNDGHLHKCTSDAFDMAILALKSQLENRPTSSNQFIDSVYKELYD